MIVFIVALGLLAVSCTAAAPSPVPAPSPEPSTQPERPQPTAQVAAPSASVVEAAPPPVWEELPSRRLPPEFTTPGAEPEGSFTCGGFQVEHKADATSGNEPYVRVSDASGKRVYQARGREYSAGPGEPKLRMSLMAEWCGDLGGDGVPELFLSERTIGAHCCYTYYIVSLTSPAKRLLMWEKGDGGHGMLPVKLAPGPAWQLLSWDIVTPPFKAEEGDPVLSYATTPSFPVVFALVGDRYQKRTFAFKEGLAKRRAEEREECKAEPQRCPIDELIEWGYGLIIGDWNREKLTAVPDAALRKRLDARAAAMKKLLEDRLGR